MDGRSAGSERRGADEAVGKAPADETINVVLAADDDFLPFAAVTLASLLHHYTGHRPLRVFLLVGDFLPEVHRLRFEALGRIHPFRLEQRVVDARALANIRTSVGLSVASYFRLFMHELLPADVRKVIYLDSDLIVRHSIEELFDEPLGEHVVAGVEDANSREFRRRYDIPDGGLHINAGVMLVNVERLRAIGFSALLTDFVARNHHRIVFGDQQILGELFARQMRYLPVKWNMHQRMLDAEWVREAAGVRNDLDARELAQAALDPAIIHFTSREKPWVSLAHPRAGLWFDYLALTDYAGDVRRPRPAPVPAAPSRPAAPPYRLVDKAARLLGLPGSKRRASAPAKKPPPKTEQAIRLKQVLTERAAGAPAAFNARQALSAFRPNARVLSNGSRDELVGGWAENVKHAFRTAYVGAEQTSSFEAVALFSQRLQHARFWTCVEAAYLYEKPLYFIDIAPFAGLASPLDTRARFEERRALGYLVDDLGYPFDSRQPSRLERMLNDPAFAITQAQRARARSLIERIVREKVTRYNIGPAPLAGAFDARPGSVLVAMQASNAAVVEFAGGVEGSLEAMTLAACAENRGASVYLRHDPDVPADQRPTFERYVHRNLSVVADEVPLPFLLDGCDTVYTLSSEIGFEALVRGKRVVTFGQPFYAGWGLTEDRNPVGRRTASRTIEEIFHAVCIELSVYVDPSTGTLVEMERMLDLVADLKRHRVMVA